MLENDDSIIAIGKRLVYLRKLARLKRNALAAQADVTGTSISLWENASSTGTMTSKSMQKILGALRKNGIEASESWLRAGIGDPPRKLPVPPNKNFTEVHSLELYPKIPLDENNLILKSAEGLSQEIKLFASLSDLTVITKVEHSFFVPFLEKGDFVGGIWQSSASINEPTICIAQLTNGLSVGCIEKSMEKDLFNIHYSLKNNDPLTIRNIELKIVAPILRVWK